jgi:hypothetical protein
VATNSGLEATTAAFAAAGRMGADPVLLYPYFDTVIVGSMSG